MATTRVDQAQHREHAPAGWLAFFQARPDLGVVAFGYGTLVAVNRLRRHAREMHGPHAVAAPSQAELDYAVRDLVAEVRELGHLTSQPREDIDMFTREAERLLRAAVAERCSWDSLAAGCRRFTTLFAADFADVVDELYAAASDPFEDGGDATDAARNVCQAAWAALAEAGYPTAPAQAPGRVATVCC
ncbi:hypothetical protein [Anaeromyxobacter sp. SG64]|uniref:hypothetical protein n=1 Tax=Anaeromyxobacter sp. SG64 TaxID=2925409 RepID=UPI001F562C3C|nr:hypothetical protein [Anaeromyxobacter sp. SG64]